jgi:hypothetical protein
MPLADWEWGYNGLTFGGAQVIGVVDVTGVDPPDIKTDETEKTGAAGGSYFGQFYFMRHVIISGDIMQVGGTFETNINTLRNTFAARTNDLPLTFQLPGVNRRRINCRPKRLNIPMSGQYDIGYALWAVELVAADPAIYDDTTSTKIFDG